MSFKVTIINNENGEVLVNNENAVAIIGSIADEESVQCLGFTRCNGVQLAYAVSGAKKSIAECIADKPLVEFFSKITDETVSENGENEA